MSKFEKYFLKIFFNYIDINCDFNNHFKCLETYQKNPNKASL